jgi:hypothetical protein
MLMYVELEIIDDPWSCRSDASTEELHSVGVGDKRGGAEPSVTHTRSEYPQPCRCSAPRADEDERSTCSDC